MFKGKELNEDLKTLKDLGLGPNDNQVTLFVSLRNQFELDMEMQKGELVQNNELINKSLEELKNFMPDI